MTEHKRRSPCCDDEAIRYLTSRNPDLAVFTVDSLLAAVDLHTYYDPDANVFVLGPCIAHKMSPDEFATAIIQATKEAERAVERCQHVWVTTWGTSATREHCAECHDVRPAKEAERE